MLFMKFKQNKLFFTLKQKYLLLILILTVDLYFNFYYKLMPIL